MAEEGPHQDSIDNPKPAMDTHLLDCPICLEQLHQPKSLPCLHSFCQKCLSTFITKDPSEKMAAATSFLCPVCRMITQPVNHSEGKEKWAQQFPTNGLINSLVKVTMDEPKYCNPCEKKGKTRIPASIWCETLNIMFCDTCKVDFHDLVHEGCETANLAKPAEIMQRQEQVRCGKHAKKMTYHCENHQKLGCSRCITIDHRRCDEVTTTQEYCDKLKRESRLDHWKTSLQKTTEAIGLLIQEFDEQLQSIANDQDIGFKSLIDLRQSVDARLDAMQKKITDELTAIYKKEKENLDLSLQKCKRLTSSIQNTIKTSATVSQRIDSVDTILLYQRGVAEMKSYQDLVTEMRKSFIAVRIKHSFDLDLLQMEKNIPLTLGKVTVQRERRILPGQLFTPLAECRVKEIAKFNIKSSSDGSDCCASGIVYLPDDHIIVGDCNNKKVKLFTAIGKLEDELKVSGSLMDMCRVDYQTVAVTLSSLIAVYVIKVESSKLTLLLKIQLPAGQDLRGITYTGNIFIVSYGSNVHIVSKDGSTKHMRTYPTYCCHLACNPWTQEIYVSQPTSLNGSVTVSKFSNETRTDIAKVGVLNSAFGVDIDCDGNLYVCGQASNNVVQMSADGTRIRELLRVSDGVNKPRAISVCGDKFVVTNESSKHKNEVHLFQLY
ncbi:uncharacterized protein LOC110449761 [Mizuhopecten yessoensis]|uniref:uncharacterized protein LOC110449761 n=1 Tax=Mizuhopecten yessoensis TaxID=6573 RepID=UPI000B45F426|nr:uncharacterized protein LOC110449761 [Mizuhopecten yessoensis]XP_021352495.1 uncharacterized protein LOC110449761 [Mizuhopecten yessoensis]